MKLGILLTTSPESQNSYTAVQIARAALAQGHQVSLFVMDDGIYNLRYHPKNPWAAEFMALIERGAQITLCASNAESRGLEKEEVIAGVVLGSQYDHATIVNESDRFLVFG